MAGVRLHFVFYDHITFFASIKKTKQNKKTIKQNIKSAQTHGFAFKVTKKKILLLPAFDLLDTDFTVVQNTVSNLYRVSVSSQQLPSTFALLGEPTCNCQFFFSFRFAGPGRRWQKQSDHFVGTARRTAVFRDSRHRDGRRQLQHIESDEYIGQFQRKLFQRI